MLEMVPGAFADVPNKVAIEDYNRGLAAYRENKLDEAVRLFSRACKLQPAFADAYYNLGLVYKRKQLLNKAISCFEEAIKSKPDDLEARYQLAIAFMDRH
jgi:tetratricopeptide (TPR) repeat protein